MANNNTTIIIAEDEEDPGVQHLMLFLLLLSFCLATVVGNLLVVLAVLREKSLHTATNYFITSLAVADCLVGLVVMPFSAAYEAMGQKWVFGNDWCDLWHSLDVLASTASILNLCVISLDRYWAINDPFTYPCKMSHTKASLLILLVWVCSSAISFPAILWWRAVATAPPPPFQCPFTEDTGYLVFSSTVSFYGPLTVMVFTYVRIYRAAVEHTRSLKAGGKTLSNNGITLRMHRGGGGNSASRAAAAAASMAATPGQHFIKKCNNGDATFGGGSSNGHKSLVVTNNKNNFSISKKLSKFAKEKKAAKTLGTVMGVFIICWLPFFLTNVISGVCAECIYSPVVFQVVTWLGWINSGMNPVIYACFSRDFRRAFGRILCFCCHSFSKGSRGDSSRSFGFDDDIASTNGGGGNTNSRRRKKKRRIAVNFCANKCCSCGRQRSRELKLHHQGEVQQQQQQSSPLASITAETRLPPMSDSNKTNGVRNVRILGNDGPTVNNVNNGYHAVETHLNSTSLLLLKYPLQQQQQRESSMYEIPPPNYNFDPRRSQEKLV